MRLAALCELPIEELALFASTKEETDIVLRWESGILTRRAAKFALLYEFNASVNNSTPSGTSLVWFDQSEEIDPKLNEKSKSICVGCKAQGCIDDSRIKGREVIALCNDRLP